MVGTNDVLTRAIKLCALQTYSPNSDEHFADDICPICPNWREYLLTASAGCQDCIHGSSCVCHCQRCRQMHIQSHGNFCSSSEFSGRENFQGPCAPCCLVMRDPVQTDTSRDGPSDSFLERVWRSAMNCKQRDVSRMCDAIEMFSSDYILCLITQVCIRLMKRNIDGNLISVSKLAIVIIQVVL